MLKLYKLLSYIVYYSVACCFNSGIKIIFIYFTICILLTLLLLTTQINFLARDNISVNLRVYSSGLDAIRTMIVCLIMCSELTHLEFLFWFNIVILHILELDCPFDFLVFNLSLIICAISVLVLLQHLGINTDISQHTLSQSCCLDD